VAGNPFDDVSVENFNIMPRELCFRLLPEYDKILSRAVPSAGHDHGPRVFTSFNAFPFVDLAKQVKDVKDLRTELVFVGVPLIPIDAGNANQKDGVSICVAGATTINNSGPFRISAGQLVAWDVPKAFSGTDKYAGAKDLVKVSGTPARKALAMTVPVDSLDDSGTLGISAAELLAQVGGASPPPAPNGGSAPKPPPFL
jgi:hypothetical protein